MIFWQKKQTENLTSEELEKIKKKISDLADDVADVQRSLRILQTETANLRGWLNRKLGVIKENLKEEEKSVLKEEERAKGLNTDEHLVFTGIPYGAIKDFK